MACGIDPAPLWGSDLTHHLLTAGDREQMLLQQMQPPPPALSREMSGESKGAWGKGKQGREGCQHLRLPLADAATGPATTHLCAQLYALASPAHSFIPFSVREKLIPLLQTEQKSAVTRAKQNARLLLLFIDLLCNQHFENYFTLKSTSARHFLYYSFFFFFGSTKCVVNSAKQRALVCLWM